MVKPHDDNFVENSENRMIMTAAAHTSQPYGIRLQSSISVVTRLPGEPL
jgi:hypothetical protein